MTRHFYLSTACQHELHDECRRSCTFCAAPCRCGCHRPDPPDSEPARTDRVEIQGGLIHLPAEFREVAALANRAGIESFEFADAEYDIQCPEPDPDPEWPRVYLVLTYRRRNHADPS